MTNDPPKETWLKERQAYLRAVEVEKEAKEAAGRQLLADAIARSLRQKEQPGRKEKAMEEAHRTAIVTTLIGSRLTKADVRAKVEEQLGDAFVLARFEAAWSETPDDLKFKQGENPNRSLKARSKPSGQTL